MKKRDHIKKLIDELYGTLQRSYLEKQLGGEGSDKFTDVIKALGSVCAKDLDDLDVFKFPKKLVAYYYPYDNYYEGSVYWVDADDMVFAVYTMDVYARVSKTWPVKRFSVVK